MTHGWLVVASLAAGAFASPPEPDDGRGGIVVSLSADRSSCNLDLAREVELVRLARDYPDLRGECVAVRGWRHGRALFPRYEDAASASPDATEGRRAVGLYGKDSVLDPAPPGPRLVAVAGVVGGCEYLPDGSAGYCHSRLDGGFLITSDIRPLP